MTLNCVDHKEKREDGKFLQRDEFTLGDHYRVIRLTTTYEESIPMHKKGFTITNFSVRKDDEYIPEIVYHIFGKEKPEFKVQTCAYGAQRADVIEKIIAGYQEALEAVSILKLNFC